MCAAPEKNTTHLVVSHRLKIPLSEFQFTFSRSGGPGGQNVNKVSTKATLRWRVTASPSLPDEIRARFLTAWRTRITTDGDVLVASQRYRDQQPNIADCLEKLRVMLLEAVHVPKARRATKPSKGSIVRRREKKQANSQKKNLRKKIIRGE